MRLDDNKGQALTSILLGLKAVEFLDNLADGFSVSRGALLFLQSQEFPD